MGHIVNGMEWAAPGRAWAVGQPKYNGFYIRRIVWELAMAQAERRDDEEIRAVSILVEKTWKARHRRPQAKTERKVL